MSHYLGANTDRVYIGRHQRDESNISIVMKDFNRVISSKSIEQIDRIELRSLDSGRKIGINKPPLHNFSKANYGGFGGNGSLKVIDAYNSVGLPIDKK
jgi:hypothetical protein